MTILKVRNKIPLKKDYRMFVINQYMGTYDDATKFINAAGLTDSTQINAINTLVNDLKSAELWDKMKAIYPFVGGVESSHKFNLKDPRDLDIAFRLVETGTITHSSTGVISSGAYSVLNTKLQPSASLNQNSTHISYYSRTNSSGGYGDMGIQLPTPYLQLTISYAGLDYSSVNSNSAGIGGIPTDTKGLFILNRTSSTNTTKIKNNGVIGTASLASNGLSSGEICILGLGGSGFWTNRECAFASIGDGLTDTDAANLYDIVQAYQTTLDRNV